MHVFDHNFLCRSFERLVNFSLRNLEQQRVMGAQVMDVAKATTEIKITRKIK